MGVVIVESPGDVVFSKNPVLFRFRSDSRYSNAGRVYQGGINVNALGSSGQTLTISYANEEIVFTLATNPDDSGLQLPTPDPDDTVDSWAEKLRAGLRKNYYLNRDFDIGAHTNANGILFISHKKDADMNVSYAQSSALFSFFSLQAAVTRTVQPNFKILCELWVEDDAGIFARYIDSALETDGDGTAYWDLSSQLTSALLMYGHDRPNMRMKEFVRSKKTGRRWYVRYAEMYGTRQRVREVHDSDVKWGILGGYSKATYREYSFPSHFVRGGLIKWMDQSDNFRTLKPLQPDFLSAVNFLPAMDNVRVRAKLYYSDLTEQVITLHNYGQWSAYERLVIPIGVSDNSLHLVNEDKVIARYDVWLENGATAVSEVMQVVLNYRYEPYLRFVLYENSYGGYETRYLYGRKSNGYDVVQKNARLVSQHPFDLTDGEEITYSAHLTDEERVNTGYMTRRQTRGFREFFLSTEKWVYKLGRYYPVQLTTASIKEYEDGNNLYALEFALAGTYTEELWTDEGEEDAYAYAPDLSGYIPAPPDVPENFDDRYYLKTETYNRAEIDSKISTLRNQVNSELDRMWDEYDEVRILLNNKAAKDHTHPEYAEISYVDDMIADVALWSGKWNAVDPDEDDGYYGGVYVVHEDMIWRSLADDNFEEPGTGDLWEIVLRGGSKIIRDDTVGYMDTSAVLNGKYPDVPVGTEVYNNNVKWTKMDVDVWSVRGIEIK